MVFIYFIEVNSNFKNSMNSTNSMNSILFAMVGNKRYN